MEHALHRTETVPCVTDQWNFPHDKDRPWVDNDGACSICGETVDHDQLGPDSPCRYTRIAKPHTRSVRWFLIDEDELRDLVEYRANW